MPSHPPPTLLRGKSVARLACLVMGLVPLLAHAASRVQFELADPNVTVVVDQNQLIAVGPPNKRTANHLTPGPHQVVILRGATELSRTRLDVPDGASVMVRVDAAGGLSVTGATASASTAGGGKATGGVTHAPPPAAEASAEAPKGAGGSALTAAEQSDSLQPEATNSLDMNEGGGGGISGPDAGPAGDYSSWSRTVGTAGRVAGGVVAPGIGGSVVGTVAPAAAYGAASVVRNAEAGGLSALQGGSTFQQGRPIPKKADTGMVAFQCPSGDPIVVYLDGFVIAQVGPQAPKSKAKLEVGRHKLEFMDAETGQYIYRGVVQIEKDETITLEIGDAAPPRALDHAWDWSAR